MLLVGRGECDGYRCGDEEKIVSMTRACVSVAPELRDHFSRHPPPDGTHRKTDQRHERFGNGETRDAPDRESEEDYVASHVGRETWPSAENLPRPPFGHSRHAYKDRGWCARTRKLCLLHFAHGWGRQEFPSKPSKSMGSNGQAVNVSTRGCLFAGTCPVKPLRNPLGSVNEAATGPFSD